jgi:hypothetical protein
MSFKEDLKAKIQLDKLTKEIAATIRKAPEHSQLNKDAVRKLLQLTDFEYMKARDLHLFVRPLKGDLKEILVRDNELPIYHTTVADVAMRKTPDWKEMLSIRNVKRILNDQDVIMSKGNASLERIHANALALLDLSYTREDIAAVVLDATLGLENNSPGQVEESLDVFFELLGFQALDVGAPEQNVQVYGRPKDDGKHVKSYEDIILFDPGNLQLKMLKGIFSPQRDTDLARLLHCIRGEQPVDLEAEEVFAFLAELALQHPRHREDIQSTD